MLQADKLQAMAIAAFSKPRKATGFHHAVMPDVDDDGTMADTDATMADTEATE